MPTMLVLPWRRTAEPRPEHALLFASRFDSSGLRQGWRLFIGGVRLRRAVLRAPGALGVSLLARPLSGHYYTLSLWRDEESLLAFAHDRAHQDAVASMTELGPPRGVLASRPADPHRPSWPAILRWLATMEDGPYRHDGGNGVSRVGGTGAEALSRGLILGIEPSE
jgi:heme-degrading monooxygenase HmoA